MKWHIIHEFSATDTTLAPWDYTYWVHMSQVVTDFMAINEIFKKLPIGTEDSHQVYC